MAFFLSIYTDGGARGNPGPAGIGAIAYNKKGEEVFKISKFLGRATNNQAEYQAVLAALEKAKQIGADQVEVFMDSQLVARQLNGEYKVKNKDLAPLFVKIYNLTFNFKSVKFIYIPREKNKEADRLANQAMDRAGDEVKK